MRLWAERIAVWLSPSYLRSFSADETEIAGNFSTLAMVPGTLGRRELDRLDPARDCGNAGRATAVPDFADKKAENVTGRIQMVAVELFWGGADLSMLQTVIIPVHHSISSSFPSYCAFVRSVRAFSDNRPPRCASRAQRVGRSCPFPFRRD